MVKFKKFNEHERPKKLQFHRNVWKIKKFNIRLKNCSHKLEGSLTINRQSKKKINNVLTSSSYRNPSDSSVYKLQHIVVKTPLSHLTNNRGSRSRRSISVILLLYIIHKVYTCTNIHYKVSSIWWMKLSRVGWNNPWKTGVLGSHKSPAILIYLCLPIGSVSLVQYNSIKCNIPTAESERRGLDDLHVDSTVGTFIWSLPVVLLSFRCHSCYCYWYWYWNWCCWYWCCS